MPHNKVKNIFKMTNTFQREKCNFFKKKRFERHELQTEQEKGYKFGSSRIS